MGEWFLENDPAYILRRLEVVLMEDVGIANPLLVLDYMLSSSKQRIAKLPGLLQQLCVSAKDRNAAELVQAAEVHSSFECHRSEYTLLDDKDLIAIIENDTASIYQRVIAAWHLAGSKAYPSEHIISQRQSFNTLMDVLRDMGMPKDVVEVVRRATAKKLYNMGLGIAFAWVMAKDGSTVIQETPMNDVMLGDIPACAYDKHTRLGKTAIAEFAASCKPVHELLKDTPMAYTLKAVGLAVFCVESQCVNQRFIYNNWQEPLRLSTEGYLCTKYFVPEHLSKLLESVKENLPTLNKNRTPPLLKVK